MWRFNRATEISGGVFVSDYDANIHTRYRSLHANLKHRLSMGHELTIMIQQSEIRGIRGSQATDYRITYAVPFGVPDPRTKNAILSINGRVYDAETGIGIEGVLFFLGDTVTVSGQDGVLRFLDQDLESNTCEWTGEALDLAVFPTWTCLSG